VGRLENRVRRLEETVERGGFAAALSRATDADIFTLADYAQRAHDAEEAGEPIPTLTSEEAEAAARFEELREQAIRDGWNEGRYRIF
jgi:hypothetical protein